LNGLETFLLAVNKEGMWHILENVVLNMYIFKWGLIYMISSSNIKNMTTFLNILGVIKIKVNNYEYMLNEFDKKNLFLESKGIFEKKQYLNAILHPAGPSQLILSVIILPFLQLKSVIDDASTDITNRLAKGNKVIVDECLGEYCGLSYLEGIKEQHYQVRFNDMYIYLPFSRAWRINKYEGTRVKLDNYHKKNKSESESARVVLKKILNLEDKDISAIPESKTLIIIDKKDISDYFNNLCINDIPIRNLLPAGYYKNATDFIKLGSDTLQRNPFILFASNLSVANDLINIYKINTVIIHNYNKIQSNIVFLQNIIDCKYVHNINLLQDIYRLDPDDIKQLNLLNFSIYPWIDKNLKSLAISSDIIADNYLSRGQNILAMIDSCNRKIEIIETELDNILSDLHNKLYKLRRCFFDHEYKIPFIRKGYFIISNIRNVPIPTLEEIDFYYVFLHDMRSMANYMKSSMPDLDYNFLTEIIDDIKFLIEIHKEIHPKYNIFKQKASALKSEDALIVNRERNIPMFKKYFDLENTNVITLNELLKTRQLYHEIIFTGWYGEDHAKVFLKASASKQTYLMYKSEEKCYKRYYEKIENNYSNRIYETDIPNILKEYAFDLSAILNREPKINIETTDLLKNNSIDAYYVEFEDGFYAYLSENKYFRCIDREKENINKKKVTELEHTDEVIFIKNSSVDIFDEIVNKMQANSSEIKKSVMKTNIWRESLKEYMETHGFTCYDVQKKLDNVGCNRNIATIRGWLYDNTCIGPEDEALDALARITYNSYFINNIDDIKISCKKIRTIHTQIGRYLAKLIVQSISNDNLEINPLIMDITNDLSQYAHVVTIRKIDSKTTKIPAVHANRVFENY